MGGQGDAPYQSLDEAEKYMPYLHTHWRTIKILSFSVKTDVKVNIFSKIMKDWKKMTAFKAPFSQST